MDATSLLRAQSTNIFVLIIFLLILCTLTTNTQAEAPSDSTWAISTVVLNTNQDDTLDYIGRNVKVGGIANTSFPQIHTTRLTSFIQNENVGLPLFSKSMGDTFEAGDSLVIEGRLQNYNGLNELYVESYEVYPNENRSIDPQKVLDVARFPDDFIGMLIEGTGKVIDKGTLNNGKYLAISVDDNYDFEPKIFVSNFHKSFGNFNFDVLSIGDEITFTGALSKYVDDSGSHNYLVYLRTPDDLQYAGLPRYYFFGIAGFALIIFIGAGAWILSLRRKVNTKTAQIQESLEEKEILLREIHHRVKNNLSIISGLLDLQKDTTKVESTLNALQDSQSRIRSMALIHDKLYQTETLSNIRLDEYLQELVEAISTTFVNKHNSVAFKFELDATKIDIDKVVPCGLLVNELVVNAFKHAFDDTEEGVLAVNLENNGDQATLTVRDNGPGLPDDFDLDSGGTLGSMLIQTFAAQLNADLTIDQDQPGTAFVFTFPLN